jgi:hypothetical protein
LFEHKYGALRAVVLKAFDDYLNCGILFHGCARAVCSDCGHSELIAYSCKRKNVCPSCDAKRAVIFAENLHEHVLPKLPIRHLVFSIPKRIRPFFRFDRKLSQILYAAAAQSWREYVADVFPEERTGMVSSLHCAGDLLHFHPHCHAVVLDGAKDSAGQFHQLSEVDTAQLERSFQLRVLDALQERGLLEPDVVWNMLSWEHSGFQVYAGEVIRADDADRRRFLGRYLKKSAVSLARLELDETGLEPVVRLVKHCDDGDKTRELSPLEFLAELSTQVADVSEQSSRYYGIFSARTRGAQRERERVAEMLKRVREGRKDESPKLLPESERPESKRKASASWAACMRRMFDFDPLACPKCGGRMVIKAFLHDSKEIQRLCKNLGLEAWRAPPPLARGSLFQEAA